MGLPKNPFLMLQKVYSISTNRRRPWLCDYGRRLISEGCGFESHHRILDAHVFTYICCKICKDENKRKRWMSHLKKQHCTTFGSHQKMAYGDEEACECWSFQAAVVCHFNALSTPETSETYSSYQPVWPDLAIFWTLGNLLKPLATYILPKCPLHS